MKNIRDFSDRELSTMLFELVIITPKERREFNQIKAELVRRAKAKRPKTRRL